MVDCVQTEVRNDSPSGSVPVISLVKYFGIANPWILAISAYKSDLIKMKLGHCGMHVAMGACELEGLLPPKI